jgi:hypothetical protein
MAGSSVSLQLRCDNETDRVDLYETLIFICQTRGNAGLAVVWAAANGIAAHTSGPSGAVVGPLDPILDVLNARIIEPCWGLFATPSGDSERQLPAPWPPAVPDPLRRFPTSAFGRRASRMPDGGRRRCHRAGLTIELYVIMSFITYMNANESDPLPAS